MEIAHPIQLKKPIDDALTNTVKHRRTFFIFGYSIEVESFPRETLNIPINWMHECTDNLNQ